MTEVITAKDQFLALIQSRKVKHLPKDIAYAERERAKLIVLRAQGWANSSFFRVESQETAQHVSLLHSIKVA